MPNLEDYYEIVGDEVISEIYKKARKLYGARIIHVNSTYQGGGVAELLNSLIPLFNDIGVDCEWSILHGNPDFFSITKKFHNALQGDSINFTKIKKDIYVDTNRHFSVFTHIDHDCVIIHDPQPLPMIKFYKKAQPWIWRCHIDLSHPNETLWNFLKRFVIRYDMYVVSSEKYRRKSLPLEHAIFAPAIDPLTPKNKEITDRDIKKYLRKFEIPTDKPIITQISRFDKWKDPLGVLEVFKEVKKEVDCRLILCGSSATDDPEGFQIYEMVKNKAKKYLDTRDVILITEENHMLVNVLQRSSDVIIQKSKREGFGLTVTEALWKEKPVVASNIGGIPLQIKDGQNGFLVEPSDNKTWVNRIATILTNKELAEKIGKNAKETVREKFLTTRLLTNYLDLLIFNMGGQ